MCSGVGFHTLEALGLAARAARSISDAYTITVGQDPQAPCVIESQAVGAVEHVLRVDIGGEWGHDLPAMLKAIDSNTRVVFIANPNNPTGTWFDANALNEFLQDVPECVLVGAGRGRR